MKEERAKQLIEIEKAGGEIYESTKAFHLAFLDGFLNQVLVYFDAAKSDSEREDVFKRYVISNRKIHKDDQRDILQYGIERERKKFKIMSLYEQGMYIQNDLVKYRRQFVINFSEEIQEIPIEKLQPSRHMMN